MKILYVSCSPRGDAAESHKLGQTVIGLLRENEPAATVVYRMLGYDAIPHIDDRYATALGASQVSSAELRPEGSMALSEQLIQELENADAVVIATPMHNFAVPSALKAWIDHIVRVRRTFDITRKGYIGKLRDRPVFVAIASGARFSGAHTHQPDFLTPYLKAVLGVVGLHDVTFFSVEGTSADRLVLDETKIKADQTVRDHFRRSTQTATASM